MGSEMCIRDRPRALVWLRNRHPEHAKGQAPVFRPILAGETPYEKVRIAASLLSLMAYSASRRRRDRRDDGVWVPPDAIAATSRHDALDAAPTRRRPPRLDA